MGQNTCSVTLTGNLTRDPKSFAEGARCAFDVAVNSSVKQAGEWVEHTSYLRVVSFKRLAERCAGALAKGQKVCVSGELVIRKREREGVTHTTVEVSARSVEFLSPRREAVGEAVPPAASTPQAAGESWDDIPF
jgi:single-strand DNA-binding protein